MTKSEKEIFKFSNHPLPDYTLEPSEEDQAKYTFDPPKRQIHIESGDGCHSGQDFKAKKK
jgi:hypothetical protein